MPSAEHMSDDRARDVTVPPADQPGTLRVPDRAKGLVVFAHGSGSSHRSPRNNAVAEVLHDAGLATLLFDLLTEAEARDRGNVFDIPLLANRLIAAVEWARGREDLGRLPVGLFGSSTGAAAALVAAARTSDVVRAVVARGGRPDLAGAALGEVKVPTRLIVGSLDSTVLDVNREARARIPGKTDLQVIRDATHLFEEPGKLDEVARLAREWFLAKLTR